MYFRPISIGEAAKAMGLTKSGVVKAISSKRLVAVPLSGRGLMLCLEQCKGQPFDAAEFRKLCKRWICVPDACDIVCKTDAMVMRDLRSGKIKGFRLNGRAWAVEKASAEQEWKDYVSGPPSKGQPRQIGVSRSPRVIRKKTLHAKKATVRSRPGSK